MNKYGVILLIAVMSFIVACATKNNDPDQWYPKSDIRHTDSLEKIKAAADAGDPEAMYLFYLKTKFTKDPHVFTQSNQYLIKAAEKRHYWAESGLAQYYSEGTFGFPRDLRKALYWRQRISCDYTLRGGSHFYLADLYSGIDYHINVTPQERALVQKNMPLAYAHLRIDRVGRTFEDDMRKLMTDAEIKQSDAILKIFENGGCPYGN